MQHSQSSNEDSTILTLCWILARYIEAIFLDNFHGKTQRTLTCISGVDWPQHCGNCQLRNC